MTSFRIQESRGSRDQRSRTSPQLPWRSAAANLSADESKHSLRRATTDSRRRTRAARLVQCNARGVPPQEPMILTLSRDASAPTVRNSTDSSREISYLAVGHDGAHADRVGGAERKRTWPAGKPLGEEDVAAVGAVEIESLLRSRPDKGAVRRRNLRGAWGRSRCNLGHTSQALATAAGAGSTAQGCWTRSAISLRT